MIEFYVAETYIDTIKHIDEDKKLDCNLYSIQIKEETEINDFRMTEKLNIGILKYRSAISVALDLSDIQDPKHSISPPFYMIKSCIMFKTKEEALAGINNLNLIMRG